MQQGYVPLIYSVVKVVSYFTHLFVNTRGHILLKFSDLIHIDEIIPLYGLLRNSRRVHVHILACWALAISPPNPVLCPHIAVGSNRQVL